MANPLETLLDLDAGRLPSLICRLDGVDHPLRRPEALPLADALRLGDCIARLTTPSLADAAAGEIVRLIAPQLEPRQPDLEPGLPPSLEPGLEPGLKRSIVAFYLTHLADAAERLATAGGEGTIVRLPFPPATPHSAAPASPPPTASASGSS